MNHLNLRACNQVCSERILALRYHLGVTLFLILSCTQRGDAHDFEFVVSRDAGPNPRLHVSGQIKYLDGREPLELLPGDGELTGFWCNDAPGFSTLSENGTIRDRFRLKAGHRVAIRLVRCDPGLCFVEPTSWKPVLSKQGDIYEFVQGPNGEFSIHLLSRAARVDSFKATFQFIDRAGLHADSEPFTLKFRVNKLLAAQHLVSRVRQNARSLEGHLVLTALHLLTPLFFDGHESGQIAYVCPMGCEGSKTYAKAGKCPECRMNLSDTHAHLDHNPKHGGTFFMAADYIHHLEGTLTPEGEFRLYLYDEYTKPLSAEKFRAKAEVWGPDENPRSIELKPTESGEFLTTGAMQALSYPLRVKLRVDFGSGQRQTFDFDFANPARN